jgi:hypothetical protein
VRGQLRVNSAQKLHALSARLRAGLRLRLRRVLGIVDVRLIGLRAGLSKAAGAVVAERQKLKAAQEKAIRDGGFDGVRHEDRHLFAPG